MGAWIAQAVKASIDKISKQSRCPEDTETRYELQLIILVLDRLEQARISRTYLKIDLLSLCIVIAFLKFGAVKRQTICKLRFSEGSGLA
jgi:hypothetical protein